ncbi:hypothetical protein B0A49_10674 [Cryomyces minteri]|uniref:Mmc1 C-terminal domain-containing protein n=1 Tax=Cryomyces minteri TaxID=331657 RepID=A0A4U0WJB1_9PEZI|nr:hypothetical protein B0A49_10674 [Cryomyces minteri]
MPPRLPTPRHLPNRTLQGAQKPLNIFYCPKCTIWRLSTTQPAPAASARPAKLPSSKPHLAAQTRPPTPAPSRSASTTISSRAPRVASTTAINAPVDVPEQWRELYKALERLKSEAGSYVNLSRLGLALRGLESGGDVVRIAVLGLDDSRAARLLVRILLADPLSTAGAWEKRLEDDDGGDGAALLLRYGEEDDIPPQNPLLRTMVVPSRLLQKHSIELLISTLNTNIGPGGPEAVENSQDTILVPPLQTPTSSTGRVGFVTYPVHRSLLFGDGVESAVSYGRYTALSGSAATSPQSPNIIKVALGLPRGLIKPTQQSPASDAPTVVDLDLASEALAQFRESVANSASYERGWHGSGAQTLVDWLVQGAATRGAELHVKPAIRELMTSLLDDTDAAISAEDARRLQTMLASSVPEPTRQALKQALQIWAQHAHTELRDQLEAAFASRTWRKLGWWKLFWRVDDVSMIAADVLERRWLVDAEKGIVYIAGRIDEAGYLRGGRPAAGVLAPLPERRRFGIGAEPPVLDVSELARSNSEELEAVVTVARPAARPWPQQIPAARMRLTALSVAPLQALAQKLVLQTLSTASLSAALSALMYVSISTTSAFEAAAVAALGAVWSLRRMQKRWEGARAFWEGEVREEGRVALRESEEVVGRIVERGGRARPDEEGARDRDRAREGVRRAREALERLAG